MAAAQAQDPWIVGSLRRQESLEALSRAAGALPDPQLSLGLANLPLDTFDFSQEPMTQFKVGVSQAFPRGRTRSLRRERLARLGRMQPHAREDRKGRAAAAVSHLWLDAYRNEQTIRLIEKDRNLFEHLVDVAQSSYAAASGHTLQQDLVRAQLELTRLDERLVRLRQQRDMHLGELGEWLDDPAIALAAPGGGRDPSALVPPRLVAGANPAATRQALTETLSRHPKIKSLDWKINALAASVQLARQGYWPQWTLNAGYAHRAAAPAGADRPDFFSVGVTFDAPLFTAGRQDQRVQAAQAELAAARTERALELRRLQAGYESAAAAYQRLAERRALFASRLLTEMAQQADASLAAYTNDTGDFAEAVRARIAELNARIEALDIDIDMQKSIARLNYFQLGTGAPAPGGATAPANPAPASAAAMPVANLTPVGAAEASAAATAHSPATTPGGATAAANPTPVDTAAASATAGDANAAHR